MDPRSDIDLIHASRKGDDAAFALLVERYLPSVYRFLLRMVGDASTAEDLAQETFVKVWRNLGKFNRAKSFKTWIFSIAKHTAIDYLRKKNPIVFSQLESEEMPDFGETIPDVQPLAHEFLARKETAKFLEGALAKLPPQARSVLLMHETENLTFQEISDVMHEPMNTVKSRYRRALTSLKKLLVDEGKNILT